MEWIWIVVVLLLVVAIAVGLIAVFSKTTAATRGGVEHGRRRRRGNPPFESIER